MALTAALCWLNRKSGWPCGREAADQTKSWLSLPPEARTRSSELHLCHIQDTRFIQESGLVRVARAFSFLYILVYIYILKKHVL